MQDVCAVTLECFDLFLALSLLVLDDILFALGLGIALNLGLHINRLFPLIIALNHVPIKLLFGLFIHHLVGIVIDIFLFLNFFRMIHNHIGLEIKLGYVHGYIILIVHSIVHILFELVFKVGVDRVVEQVLPFNSFLWVHSEHASDYVFSDFRDLVDGFGEVQRFVLDVVDQIHHVAGFVGWGPVKRLVKYHTD